MDNANNKFKALILKKIRDKGYKSIRQFSEETGVARSPITKTIRGISMPERATVQRWCDLLDCSSQERAEIFQAIYVPEDDEVPDHAA